MPRATGRSSPIFRILPSSTRITACSSVPLAMVSARPTRIANRLGSCVEFSPADATGARLRRRVWRIMFASLPCASEPLSVALPVVFDVPVDQHRLDARARVERFAVAHHHVGVLARLEASEPAGEAEDLGRVDR